MSGNGAVRPYQPVDREAVLRIAADTAYFGEPIEAYFDDRQLFCDAFYGYYTDYEPEHGWVAVTGDSGGGVIGFLMGSTDPLRQNRAFIQKILPRVVLRSLTGRYRFGLRTLRYVTGLAGAWLRGELPGVDLSIYPAHLHINLSAEWRRFGLGQRLIEMYLEQLGRLGLSGVHLKTTTQNMAACSLYEKMGFTLLDSRPTRLWRNYFQRPVYNLCYGLKLR